MPGVALSNFVTTAVRQNFFPAAIDNVYTGNLLFDTLRSKARPWRGGYQGSITLTVSNRTQGGSFSGFDTLSTTQEDVRTRATFDPSEYYVPVVFSGIQLAVNKGPEAFLNLMAEEFTDAAKTLAEDMGTDLYLDGTNNANKAIAGLQYHVDDATTAVTWQGLSRNTYTNLRSTRTAQSGALSFTNLATDTDAAQRGNDSPDLIITTPAIYSIIERLVSPTLYLNYNGPVGRGVPAGQGSGGNTLNYGSQNITWRGIPIIADEMATAGNIYTLNTKHLFLYQLDYSNEVVDTVKEGFAWSGWKKGPTQNAIVSHLLWAGQLVGDAPRTMARRTGVTS